MLLIAALVYCVAVSTGKLVAPLPAEEQCHPNVVTRPVPPPRVYNSIADAVNDSLVKVGEEVALPFTIGTAGMKELLQNFLLSTNKLQAPVPWVSFALDPAAVTEFAAVPYARVYTGLQNLSTLANISSEYSNFGSKEFRTIVLSKFVAALQVMDTSGAGVIYADTDIVMKRNILGYLVR